ncbi:MAG: hypothetical protein ABI977_05225 [Acidobacteriota bacterium]
MWGPFARREFYITSPADHQAIIGVIRDCLTTTVAGVAHFWLRATLAA